MTRHPQPALDELLPPLDDHPGPATPLPAAAQQALIESALAAKPTPPGVGTRRGFLLGGTVAVISGGLAYRLTRRAAVAPQLVATQPTVLPDSVPPTAPPAMVPPVVAAAPPPAVEKAPAPAEKVSARKRVSAPREVADLLNQANEQRRQQRFPQALRLYQQIREQHPRSDEAYVAQVAAASLLVDRLHEPQAALRMHPSESILHVAAR